MIREELFFLLFVMGPVLFFREMTARGKRVRELLAEKMGMTLLPPLSGEWGWIWKRQKDPHWKMAKSMANLRLFSGINRSIRGKARRKFKYIMKGDPQKLQLRDTVEVKIFEYHRTNAPLVIPVFIKTTVQTVMYFSDSRLSLPEFAVRPERFRHKIGSTLHMVNDIDFQSNGTAIEFSSQYLLSGPKDGEEQIRELFTDEVLRCFADKNEICVDGSDSQLIFYRADVAIQPRQETFRPFVEEAVEIYQVLSDSNTQKY